MTYFFRGIHFATILIKRCLTCFMDTDPGFSIAKLKLNPSTPFKVPDSSAYPSKINESLAQLNLEPQEGNCFECKHAFWWHWINLVLKIISWINISIDCMKQFIALFPVLFSCKTWLDAEISFKVFITWVLYPSHVNHFFPQPSE